MLAITLPGQAMAYFVSGVVGYTYNYTETKTGNTRSSYTSMAENYQANTGGFLWDPRFIRFSAGVGYNVYHANTDSRSLNYNVQALFFPGLKIFWSLYGMRSEDTVESSPGVPGTLVTNSSYGGVLNMYLNKRRSRGNNNNNNNNNNSRNNNNNGRNNNNNNNYGNNRGGRRGMVLPDIVITYHHSDANSSSSLRSLSESRDNTTANVSYRFRKFDLNLDASWESYTNKISKGGYDNKSLGFQSNIFLFRNATLRFTGQVAERSTNNMTGFAARETSDSIGAVLGFKERYGFVHAYNYAYTSLQTASADYTTHSLGANVAYKLIEDLTLVGVANRTTSLYQQKQSNLVLTSERVRVETESVSGGTSYKRIYAPGFLTSFLFNANYDFSAGYNKYTNVTTGESGSGSFYSNAAGIGMSSNGWEYESLALDYSLSMTRDFSDLTSDKTSQSYKLSLNSSRITRTTVRANASYSVIDIRNNSTVVSYMQPYVHQQHRSSSYDASAVYTANANLSLTAGATRGKAKSTTYTLSTLEPPSALETSEDTYFAGADFSYQMTRNVSFSVAARDEYRSSQLIKSEDYQINSSIDYRIRLIYLTLSHTWREDVPENGLRVFTQAVAVKVQRPF